MIKKTDKNDKSNKKTKKNERVFKKESLKIPKYTQITRIMKLRALMFCVLLTSVFIIAALISNILPYALTVDGEDICYMNEKQSEKLVKIISDTYIPVGAELKAISSDGSIEIDKRFKIVSRNTYVTAEAAERKLDEALAEKNDGEVRITTLSTVTINEEFTPEPKYEKDEKMLAGESEVIKKGKDGEKEITRTFITVNKVIQSSQITNTKIIKEGKAATIKKGTLGLPAGEDWRTYTGDPVYENGEALTTTALTYLGAPYKYGGKSLETGIDCVWFVVEMYKKYGIDLPANHKGLQSSGTGVSIKNAQKGDVVCYSHHVCIYLGDGKVVEANSHEGVRIGPLKKKRVVTVRRIVQ